MVRHFQVFFNTCIFFYNISRDFLKGSIFLSISRLFQMVSFFLPIKVLILASSGNNQRYSSLLTDYFSLEQYILLFSFMVPCSYVIYLVFGVMHRRCLDSSAETILKNKHTNTLFKSKGASVVKLHSHIAKALSEVILVVITTLTILVFDPLTMLLIFSIFVLLLNIIIKKTVNLKDEDRIGVLKLHRRQYIEYFSSIGFIAIFALLVLQIMYLDQGILTAVFILLVSRMLFQAMQRYSVEAIYIESLKN